MKKLKDFLKKGTIIALFCLTISNAIPPRVIVSNTICICAIPDANPDEDTRPLGPIPYN